MTALLRLADCSSPGCRIGEEEGRPPQPADELEPELWVAKLEASSATVPSSKLAAVGLGVAGGQALRGSSNDWSCEEWDWSAIDDDVEVGRRES